MIGQIVQIALQHRAIVLPFARAKLTAPAPVVPAGAAFWAMNMKLTIVEAAYVARIKQLLENGCGEHADELAGLFLKHARSDASARRRAHLLLRLATGQRA